MYMFHTIKSLNPWRHLRKHLSTLRWSLARRWRQHEVPLLLGDTARQWTWFATGVPKARIGRGFGPLTWGRNAVQPRRDLLISLVGGGETTRLIAFSINRASRRFRAVVNGDLAAADVIWICEQDPMPAARRASLERTLRRLAPGTPIVNKPSRYNAYFEPDVFRRLAAAGVTVPRSEFGPEDEGRTEVIYKQDDAHCQSKVRTLYTGPRPGWRVVGFEECHDDAGLRRRYRAHYVAGMVRGSEAFVSYDWNVCAWSTLKIDYMIELTENERRQIVRIAETLDLDYFAVDFLRRSSDASPVFLDINVHPTVATPRQLVRLRGDYGRWHTFDARARQNLPEPGGTPVWKAFDEAMLAFAARRGYRAPAIRDQAGAAEPVPAGTVVTAH